MDSNLVLTVFGSAIGVTQLIELVKRSPRFAFINTSSEQLNRLIGIVAAGAVSLGIHYEWDEATRVLAVHVPTGVQAMHLGWNWFVQWALQQYAYKTGIKSMEAPR